MKRKDIFSKLLDNISDNKGYIQEELINNVSNDIKNKIIDIIVRKRLPIIYNLLNNDTDKDWLNCMGYNNIIKGKKFKFLCTCENKFDIN